MNKLKNIVLSLGILLIISSCVDDYQDANPPRLLDGPAVNSISIDENMLFDGESATITIPVVDAPAGIDSVGYSIDVLEGDPESPGNISLDNFSELKGRTAGELVATYTAPENSAVTVELTFAVFDRQMREGEVIRKSSVARSVTVEVICSSNLEGTYDALASGSSTDPDANNNPATDVSSVVTLTATEEVGVYEIDKSTAKVFDAWYLGVYYEDPIDVAGVLVDKCGEITLESYQSPFGDGIAQSSGSVGAGGVITFTAVNDFGDEWTVVLTPQ